MPSSARRYKIVVIGDENSGKTCLLFAYSTDCFYETTTQVYGKRNATITVNNTDIEFSLLDSPGQREFENDRRQLLSDCDAVVLCFAVDCPDSLMTLPNRWLPELTVRRRRVPVILAGTKHDVRHDENIIDELNDVGKSVVTYAQGERLAKQIKAVTYVECSSKNVDGVDSLFETAAKCAVRRSTSVASCVDQCSIL